MPCTAICIIKGCGKVQNCRGYCSKHLYRLKKHGHPLAGGTESREPQRYAQEVAATADTDDCITWPYGRDGNGYGGGVTVDHGVRIKPHRYICELVHGAPKEGQQALHSCGKGHEGCVNPRHLRWGNAEDNYQDSVIHGTAIIGQANPQAKLSDDDFRQIEASRGKETAKVIAARFGITENYVYQIRGGHARRSTRSLRESA